MRQLTRPDTLGSVSILRDLPRFRYLWLSKAISSAGSGAGRVALVLLVIPSGSAAVTCTLLATMAGVLVSPWRAPSPTEPTSACCC